MWQDFVFSIGNVFFALSLIPAVVKKEAPPKTTCVITSITLGVFVLVDITLNLWLTALITFISSVMWFSLIWRRKA